MLIFVLNRPGTSRRETAALSCRDHQGSNRSMSAEGIHDSPIETARDLSVLLSVD